MSLKTALAQHRKRIAFFSTLIVAAGALLIWQTYNAMKNYYAGGIVIEQLDGVSVYDNGPLFVLSHGRHYAEDGYYFGQKWQCVEFIKRYLYTAKGLRMPDVWGNAITFFKGDLPHGTLNSARNMIQYRQGETEKPAKGDLIVFSGAGGYGHVAIVSKVTETSIEVVQQNAPPAREILPLSFKDGRWLIGKETTLGWLRVPPAS